MSTKTPVVAAREANAANKVCSCSHPSQRRHLKAFCRRYYLMPVALILGLVGCISVIVFTLCLSSKLFSCPDWATDCHISAAMQWTRGNLGLVQGIVTVVYGVGLAGLAYAAYCVSEAALWPLLTLNPFSLEEIDAYLSTSRGSIASIPAAFWAARKNRHSFLVLGLTAIVTLTPMTAAPLIGHVYQKQNATTIFESHYPIGGGIGRIFAQDNPPIVIGGESVTTYTSWAKELSDEPMPQYRDWLIDRSILDPRGNMTVRAVHNKIDIHCSGFHVPQINSTKHGSVNIATSMAKHNNDGRAMNSSNAVTVRIAPAMAVWADDFTFENANKSSAKLVFAAINGTIESGIRTEVLASARKDTWVSAVACNVAVEFEDSLLQINGGGPSNLEPATISSMALTTIALPNSTVDSSLNTFNENALYFAVTPILVGNSVGGAQPMFYSQRGWSTRGLPTQYTSTTNNPVGSNWTLDAIDEFIRVSIGAVAEASARDFRGSHPDAVVHSQAYTPKLLPVRVLYLLVPMLVVLVSGTVLLWLTVRLHRLRRVPVMRTATFDELLKSSQTEYLLTQAVIDSETQYLPSNLKGIRVMFGTAKAANGSGTVVTGLSDRVDEF